MTALTPGADLEPVTYAVTRADLVRYAGASGDFNPIHWSDRVATEVGLPGVIAHGMYTLALAGRAVSSWAGGPDRVLELGARFTKPVVVPDDETGVAVTVTGVVKESDQPGVLRVDLTVSVDDSKVLGMARALVRSTDA
ncbi:MAG: MaoC/PaaZ C-terminal domain-containing protein [Nocardioidaceae bacterium]